MKKKRPVTALTEEKIHKTILESPGKVLHGLKVLHSEFSLFPAFDMLTNEVFEQDNVSKPFGRIDLILEYKRAQYITEIKYKEPHHRSTDFWEALKVLGYEKYYRWQCNTKYKTRPAIIVPKHSIKLEQQIIAGALNLAVFAVVPQNDTFTLQMLSDRPIWHQ